MKYRVLSSCAALILVVGCQADAVPAAPPGSTASPAVAQVDPNGVLRVVSSAMATTFDPIRAAAASETQYLFPIYDTLMRADPQGNPQPMLATSWKFNDNPPSLDLTLRTDVKFRSGRAFDADVVKANIERAKSATSLLAPSLSQVATVTVLDPSHVRLNLTGPVPDLPITLTDRAGIMADPGMFDSPELATQGAGTGQFVVETFKPGAETVYKRAPSYWDPAATKLAELRWTPIVDDEARMNAVLTKQADFFLAIPPQIKRAEAAGLKIVSSASSQTEHMKFNTSRSELGKQEVRQAINFAIDRKTIVNTILENSCTVTSQFPAPGSIMHSEQVPADYYAYNPARAKELLTNAGLPNGFTFTAVVVNTDRYLPYAQAIQAQLAEVGVKMNLQPTPPSDIVNVFYVRKMGDAIISGDIASSSPTQFASDNYLPSGTRNPGGQSTPEIEDLVKKISTTNDDQQRKAYWSQLTKAVTDYALSVQICLRTLTVAMTPQVLGYTPSISGNIYVRNVSMAKQP
jgi:peptide/nickel transport system substrate-binding protein